MIVVALSGLFLLSLIDNPRVEYLRARLFDAVMPSMNWIMVPVTGAWRLVDDFQSYARIHEQNRELRRELQRMKAWKEAALQLEQQNAKLLDINNVQLDPQLTYVTGVVMADSGSPFRQSVLLNVGARDGIREGWAATDGLGLVGRIAGVGRSTSRVILLTDPNSRVPVTIRPSGQQAILSGDSSGAPLLDFIERPELARPGDRVATSGDGGVFPSGILVGQVAQTPDGRLRALLSADYERLEFLRVLRSHEIERIEEGSFLLVPPRTEPEPAVEPRTAEVDDG